MYFIVHTMHNQTTTRIPTLSKTVFPYHKLNTPKPPKYNYRLSTFMKIYLSKPTLFTTKSIIRTYHHNQSSAKDMRLFTNTNTRPKMDNNTLRTNGPTT